MHSIVPRINSTISFLLAAKRKLSVSHLYNAHAKGTTNAAWVFRKPSMWRLTVTGIPVLSNALLISLIRDDLLPSNSPITTGFSFLPSPGEPYLSG